MVKKYGKNNRFLVNDGNNEYYAYVKTEDKKRGVVLASYHNDIGDYYTGLYDITGEELKLIHDFTNNYAPEYKDGIYVVNSKKNGKVVSDIMMLDDNMKSTKIKSFTLNHANVNFAGSKLLVVEDEVFMLDRDAKQLNKVLEIEKSNSLNMMKKLICFVFGRIGMKYGFLI